MKLIEVDRENKQLVREFLEVPLSIYQGDKNFIRPLDQDIEQVFDPQKNKYFRHGVCKRWILKDNGKTIGRIAAFVNNRQNYEIPVGGMGFFECINNQEAANALLDQAKSYLESQGMQAMDGPINFGDRNSWWGCLVEGFYPPTYQMNYNPTYYQELLENYGFKVFFKQYVLFRNVLDPVQPKFTEKYQKLMKEPGYSIRHINKKEIKTYAKHFRQIYNEAWAGHEGVKEMTQPVADTIMRKMKPIIKEELMWFAFHNERPIGFFLMIPDLNEIFKHFKGKFGLIQKLKTFFKLRSKSMTRCYGILFGVVPDYQSKGVDGAIIEGASHVIHPMKTYTHMEMVWIGDFNPKMLKVATDVGGEVLKTYHTYRFLFDRERPFERMKIKGNFKSDDMEERAKEVRERLTEFKGFR